MDRKVFVAIALAISETFAESTGLADLKRLNLEGALPSDKSRDFSALLTAEALITLHVFGNAVAFLLASHATEEQVEIGDLEEVLTENGQLALHGALWELEADISAFAKVIGGGFPVACFGGTKEVMEIEAKNEVMHGGTYTASPLALAAADAVLKRIERDKETMYPRLFELSGRLRDGLVRVIRDAGFHCFGQGIGDGPHIRVRDYRYPVTRVNSETLHSACSQSATSRIFVGSASALSRPSSCCVESCI